MLRTFIPLSITQLIQIYKNETNKNIFLLKTQKKKLSKIFANRKRP